MSLFLLFCTFSRIPHACIESCGTIALTLVFPHAQSRYHYFHISYNSKCTKKQISLPIPSLPLHSLAHCSGHVNGFELNCLLWPIACDRLHYVIVLINWHLILIGVCLAKELSCLYLLLYFHAGQLLYSWEVSVHYCICDESWVDRWRTWPMHAMHDKPAISGDA